MSTVHFGNVLVERDVPCRLRDGIILYADVYRPEGPGPFPVLLMRQPYGKAIASTVSHAHPTWYANRGYLVIIQDVRGCGSSEGEFVPFVHEASDGYDAVEWAAALPYSSGRVGMYGFSYQGSTQWAAAAEKPPHLAAIAPAMCAADMYHGMFYPHGRFMLEEHLPWAFQLAREAARKAGDTAAEHFCTLVRKKTPDDLLLQTPINGEHPILKAYFPTYEDWTQRPAGDAYWEHLNWLPRLTSNPVPALIIGGWYDVFLMGTLQSYDALIRELRPEDSLHYRLIVGPWNHIPWGRRAGGVDHGAEAHGNIHLEQVRWFDYWLKQDPEVNLRAEPQVRYYELQSRCWRALGERTSPFRSGEPALRLHLGGTAQPSNGAFGGGWLTSGEEEAGAGAADVFVYDARLPMPLESFTPLDRSGIEDRHELLLYTSKPLTCSYRVYGAPKLTVAYQTLGGPTDLVAILTIVEPDGSSRFLSVGRTEIDSEQGTDTNEWKTANLELRPLAVEFYAGSSIRLELTGSAFPMLARHPNGMSGQVHQAGVNELRIATVAIGRGEGYQSYLELPIMEK
ncbi:CocE/NonD family hydrolase [Paenibacillus sp. y28]|uniref:CocE/NonD family hydrolase n=1 Tax=Paenibacillus sp. y28 TaxID=3129110 RepID=UPI0030197042